MPVIHWWDAKLKQTRQTYSQSIQSTRRQFAKSCKRSIRLRKHATNELRNVRVKLNWEEHIWNLFITTENKYYCAYSMLHVTAVLHVRSEDEIIKNRFFLKLLRTPSVAVLNITVTPSQTIFFSFLSLFGSDFPSSFLVRDDPSSADLLLYTSGRCGE